MATRIQILEESLLKKSSLVDSKLDAHFTSVAKANGQPLNDKRNGRATMASWDRQSESIRASIDSAEKTKRAIEREKSAIALVESTDVHPALKQMSEAGELNQWRKHPRMFFVPGVEKGRICWDSDKQQLGHRYLSEIPKDQYAAFRDAYNKANAVIKASTTKQ